MLCVLGGLFLLVRAPEFFLPAQWDPSIGRSFDPLASRLLGAGLLALILLSIISAIITPPDVVSQLALAIPMCILYELGILFARFVTAPPPKEAAVDAWAPASDSDEKQIQDRS